MDIIGVPEVTAEAELISSIMTFFKRIGITASDVGFKVSSRKVLQEFLKKIGTRSREHRVCFGQRSPRSCNHHCNRS
jgi:histidyl-tRNA synthetase